MTEDIATNLDDLLNNDPTICKFKDMQNSNTWVFVAQRDL